MKYTVIGDVHGKLQEFFKIVKDSQYPCLQIGDFGFSKQWDILYSRDDINDSMVKIIMGNHDYLPYLHTKYSMGDYGKVGDHSFFFRGAFSIDKLHRFYGIDWFPNEELSYLESCDLLDEYTIQKPRIIISHECPECVSKIIIEPNNQFMKTATSSLAQQMYTIHKPDLWIFGHHHKSFDETIGGTRFICLNELESKVFDL